MAGSSREPPPGAYVGDQRGKIVASYRPQPRFRLQGWVPGGFQPRGFRRGRSALAPLRFPLISEAHGGFGQLSGLGWFPRLAGVQQPPLSPIQALDPDTHDTLVQLGQQMEQLQMCSPMVPSAQADPETASEKYWCEQKECDDPAPGSQLPSETSLLPGEAPQVTKDEDDGPDVQVLEEEEEMEEGKTQDRLRAPRVKPKPKKGDPEKQFQL